jgi:hydroxymethylglutaryl-CoA synthase
MNAFAHAIQVYFPNSCLKQADYEVHTGTPAGKFVVGLGQEEMAFVDSAEDINRQVL